MLEKAKSVALLSDFDATAVSSLRFLVLHTRWNASIVHALAGGVVSTLVETYGVPRANIDVVTVPGAYELPFATKSLLAQAKAKGTPYAAAIPVGVLVKGSTMHFEYICDAVSTGLMNLGLESGTPVVFGVLTCLTEEQAELRAGLAPEGHNHGVDWAAAAVEMALLNQGTVTKSTAV
ncbi:lumazine synthase [Blastocladiella emersonii ATCC 22665]|nr:lumazine synthase [Blastocladiella emersonii ATCC 22665]